MEEKPTTAGEIQDTSEVEVEQSHFTTPPRWEKIKLHKWKILGGVLGILVLAGAILGAYELGQKQARPLTFRLFEEGESEGQPFPLDDVNATYRINKLNQRFTLSYTRDSQIQEIYIGKSLVDLEAYVNKKVLVKGEFRTEEQQVQCFKAPCPPAKVTVLDISKVQVKE